MKIYLILVIAAVAGFIGVRVEAQATSLFGGKTDVAVEYTYAHANEPPAACGCFSLNGGSVSIAQPIYSGRFAFAFDATFLQSMGVSSNEELLTLSTFTGGVRYRPRVRGRWNPFGEVLVGASHGAGSLTHAPNPAASDPALVFATNIGGGVDRRIDEHWAIRIVEADYFLTMFSNGVNDHQNNLRLSTGVVYRFGR